MARRRFAGGQGGAMKRLETVLYHFSRLLLGGLFLYAGLIKGNDVTAFARSVEIGRASCRERVC